MKTIKITAYVICVIIILAGGSGQAAEPEMPRVDLEFSLEQEQRIHRLENLTPQAVFEALGSPEFFDKEDYANKAIFRAFQSRRSEGIELAMRYVRSPQSRNSADGIRNLFTAKKIVQIFPQESLDRLLDLYSSGGPKIRANVIYAAGPMAGGEVVKRLLTEALDDTSFCQDRHPETVGPPLRICDVAYNQLVIRYKLKGVLRTIGTVHNLDVRDHHIQLLQNGL